MNRRHFLEQMTLGAGLVLPLGRHAWAATAVKPTRRKLIVVMLRGAVDGLNVVAPVADPNYARLRPTIALGAPGQDGGALRLDNYFGLHPALAPLLPLWEQKRLAFVHASGSPDATRSHFDAQDYMESATPGRKSTQDGWMNRLATLLPLLPGPANPSRALSIGPLMPRILSGPAAAMNLPNGAAATRADLLDRPQVGAAFDQLYAGHARFGKAYAQGRESHRDVMQSASAEMQTADNGAPLPNGFPADAARLANLMRGNDAIELAFVALGGWDTHARQGGASGQLAGRLAPLATGLATLAERLGPMLQDTAIVVMSEFGRTARENGSGGTDHGHGNVMWVMGGAVAGGKVLGDWHGVGDAALNEGRDLPVTTDFRAVLAQLAQRHLRLPDQRMETLFPGWTAREPGFQLFPG
ncbi:DUF1501 domain-containing protein [Massilia sp. TSP1-1-2]|uniref:DUF1501 domain-containing protein n=1 Tax=Massilia sp. TSP1-1-2 TaxID=2804649 RepID=UPI003CE72FE9